MNKQQNVPYILNYVGTVSTTFDNNSKINLETQYIKRCDYI